MAKRTNDELVAAFLGMSHEDINKGLIQGRWKSSRGKAVARAVLSGELDPAKAKAKLAQAEKDKAKAFEAPKAVEAVAEAPKAAEAPEPVNPGPKVEKNTPHKHSTPVKKDKQPWK